MMNFEFFFKIFYTKKQKFFHCSLAYYYYIILGPKGQKEKKYLQGNGLEEVLTVLKYQKIDALRLCRYWNGKILWWWLWGEGPSMAPFFFSLHCCLEGGQDLPQGLKTLGETMDFPYCLLAQDLYFSLCQGLSFSQAMARHHQFFFPFLIALVGTAETCQELSPLCLSLHDYLHRRHEEKSQLLKTLSYPLCCLFSSFFLLWFFIKNIVFSEDRGSLINDLSSERSKGFLYELFHNLYSLWEEGDVITLGFYGLCCGGFVALWVYVFYKKFLQPLLYNRYYFLFFSSLLLLNDKKIPLLQGLCMIQHHVREKFLKNLLGHLKDILQKGAPLSQGFTTKTTPFLSPLTISLMTTGEKTGHLSESLKNSLVLLQEEFYRKKKFLLSFSGPFVLFFTASLLWLLLRETLFPLYTLE